MPTLLELVGTNLITCPHQEDLSHSSISLVLPSEESDWAYMMEQHDFDPTATSIQVCCNCQTSLPSYQLVLTKRQKQSRQGAEEQEAENRQKIADGATHRCTDCEKVLFEEELVQIRECSRCDLFFDGTENGRNCVNCNRPFTRKTQDLGCPNCLSEDDNLELIIVTV